MSKPWGGVGAWALDAERAEAEERELAAAAAADSVLAGEPSQSFPSLREGATKPKSKKKKERTLTLSELATGAYVGPGGGGGRRHAATSFESRGLTPDEMLRLPTGPRERSAEELEQSRLGGGFRSYGYGGGSARGGGGFPSRRDDEGEGSWGGARGGRRSYGGGFEEEQRRGPPARVSDLDQPSRADEDDNWATNKKLFSASSVDSGRPDRYSSLGGGGASSRADEMDNWSRGKQPLQSRQSSFGSGFRDSSDPSDSGRWARGKVGGAVPYNEARERPRIVLDPPKGEGAVASEPARARPSPFGAARPREEVLAEKGLDWRKMDTEIELKKMSRPNSSQSSRPSSAQSGRMESPQPHAAPVSGGHEGSPKAQTKVNPFGEAKPREVLLEEKGKDWRKMDLELEHRMVNRPETDEEKLLKEEIDHLKKALRGTDENLHATSVQISDEITSLHQHLVQKEKDLEMLIHDLDHKFQIGQRATTDAKAGSGVGRFGVSIEGQPSQYGSSEELRSAESLERPPSRGSKGETWAKPTDSKWGFQGTTERGGSLGSRNLDRSRPRERW